MIGSWRWNLIAGGALAGLIFLLSFGDNPIGTAAYRSGVSFVVGFAMMFAIRWLLGQALAPAGDSAEGGSKADEADKGRTIDLTTPESSDDADADDGVAFAPLSPPRLKKTEAALDPEQLAQALRHMSEQ